MKHFRLCMVDSNRIEAHILAKQIHRLGVEFELTNVSSTEEAVLVMHQQTFDLLLVSQELPGKTGLELVRMAHLKYPSLKKVLMLQAPAAAQMSEADKACLDALLLKPLNHADFLDTIERILGLVKTSLKSELNIEFDAASKLKKPETLSEVLQHLLNEGGFQLVQLLGPKAQVLAQAGEQTSELTTSTLQIQSANEHSLLVDLNHKLQLSAIIHPRRLLTKSHRHQLMREAAVQINNLISRLGLMPKEPPVFATQSVTALGPQLHDPQLAQALIQFAVSKQMAELFWQQVFETQAAFLATDLQAIHSEQLVQLDQAPKPQVKV